MKSCPKCSRVYPDDALNFCLDDGEWLVNGDSDEHPTAILSGDEPSEARTVHQTTITDPSGPGSYRGSPLQTGSDRIKRLIIPICLLIAISMIGFGAYKYAVARRPATALSFEKAKLTRLTTTGKAANAAISPDGKFVVHVQDDGGQQSLWVRQTVTQSNVQIIPSASVTYDGLNFSPDGNFIYYSVSGQQFPRRILFQISTLGGTPTRILDGLDGDPISFSPDGKQFAFVRLNEGVELAIAVASSDGSAQHDLVVVKNPPESLGSPAWSPDGKRIAFGKLNYLTNEVAPCEVELSDGTVHEISSRRWFRIPQLTWMSDGNSLLMLAPAEQKFVYQIWQLAYPNGEAHQLTNDLDDYEWMSQTTDSRTLAVVKRVTEASIWLSPINDSAAARPITSGAGKADMSQSLSPDGTRIAFSSDASGNNDIWIVNSDGTGLKQLTANARQNIYPSFSPDGNEIVFLSDRSGTPHLWRMNSDGSGPRQIVNGPDGEQSPSFSPDGKWIYYSTAQSKNRTSWRVAADGSGEPIRLSDKLLSHVAVSARGDLIAAFMRDRGNSQWQLGVFASDGSQLLHTYSLPGTFERPLKWMADGHSVAYIDTHNGVSNIVLQPIDGGPVKPLTNFRSDRIFWFDLSHDGKQIATSRGTQSSDVILISGF
jgi:TolB protein